MKCVICKHGDTKKGYVTVTLQREASLIIVKEVPAQVCSNCGEYYLSEEVSEALLKRAALAVTSGTEVEIIKFAA